MVKVVQPVRYKNELPFSTLQGLELVKISLNADLSEVTFHTTAGTYILLHNQECYESVYLVDGHEELARFKGTIVLAEEYSNRVIPPMDMYESSWTWTFYKIATEYDYAVLRFYGCSNGYYSERVNLYRKEENRIQHAALH